MFTIRCNMRAWVLFAALPLSAPTLCAGEPAPKAKLDARGLAQAIDRAIQLRLNHEKIPVSPRCDDAEFLRRVYLDIHGVIPTALQARAFLESGAPDRRARLVDEL